MNTAYIRLGIDFILLGISPLIFLIKKVLLDLKITTERLKPGFLILMILLIIVNSTKIPVSDLERLIERYNNHQLIFDLEFSFHILSYFLSFFKYLFSYEYLFKFFWQIWILGFSYKACKKMNLYNNSTFLIIIITPAFFSSSLHLVQQVASLSVMLYAVSILLSNPKNTLKKYILFSFLSVTLHSSSIILVPLFFTINYIVRKKNYNYYLFLIFGVICFVFYLFKGTNVYNSIALAADTYNLGSGITDKLNYSEAFIKESSSSERPIIAYVEILILIFISLFINRSQKKNIYKVISFSILIFLPMIYLFNEIPIIETRLLKIVDMFKFFLLPIAFLSFKSSLMRYIFLLVFGIYYLSKFIMYFSTTSYTYYFVENGQYINLLFI